MTGGSATIAVTNTTTSVFFRLWYFDGSADMRVIQNIQAVDIDNNEPVDVVYYTGDDLVQALSAIVSAAATYGDDTKYYNVLSVSLVF